MVLYEEQLYTDINGVSLDNELAKIVSRAKKEAKLSGGGARRSVINRDNKRENTVKELDKSG